MGIRLKELGFKNIEDARRHLRFKDCVIRLDLTTVRCSISSGRICPLKARRCNCQVDCFKKCKLSRGLQNER